MSERHKINVTWDDQGRAIYGASLGSMLAVTISYGINHSFWWALLHGFFGWLYLIYYGLGFAG